MKTNLMRVILAAAVFVLIPVSFAAAHGIILTRHNGLWQSQPISISGATHYIFSDQYKNAGPRNNYVGNEIDITYTFSDNSTSGVRVEQFGYSKTWTKASIDFYSPPGAVSMVISHRLQGPGLLLVKNPSLSK